MINVQEIKALTEKNSQKAVELAKEIWGYAELSYEERQSAGALIQALRERGFTIEEGIAGMPTAFLASWGRGKPVLGLLAEYDALSALSQKAACPRPEPVEAGAPGHGCGHNLIAGGCFGAAAVLQDYMSAHGLEGTIRFFGCPAEEGAGSKQFIARAGYFDDVDFALTWHPATINEVGSRGSAAIMGANFIFDGIASHAGGEPHLGRSALDACELMNVGANYLREHMIDGARIHYAYSDPGGTAPNVVQGHAVIKYEVRSPKVNQVQELFTRLVDVAKGAALMTGTKMRYEITMAFSDYMADRTLGALADKCMQELGAPDWTEEDYQLAKSFLQSYSRSTMLGIKESLEAYFEPEELDAALLRPLDSKIHPFDPKETRYDSGSTDVGDVAYATPTVMLQMATACLGNVGHSWQNTAQACSQLGMKGMLRAVEAISLTALRAMEEPELLEKAKKDLLRKNGGRYQCPLPDYVTPPIGRY